jgi:hypothetical protein
VITCELEESPRVSFECSSFEDEQRLRLMLEGSPALGQTRRRGASATSEARGMTYWTPADQAEFDFLRYALKRKIAIHRERCADCAVAGSAIYCRRVDRAIREFIEWAQLRALLSRATWLAREQRREDAA